MDYDNVVVRVLSRYSIELLGKNKPLSYVPEIGVSLTSTMVGARSGGVFLHLKVSTLVQGIILGGYVYPPLKSVDMTLC